MVRNASENTPVTNSLRAQWAKAAVYVFRQETRTDAEDALSDLLCDLMHLYSAEILESQLVRARGHYTTEMREDPA